MNCNNASELYGIILFNKVIQASEYWSGGSGSYNFYDFSYDSDLEMGHTYYCRFTYKFSTSNQSPTWCSFYMQGGHGGSVPCEILNPQRDIEYTSSGILTNSLDYQRGSGHLYNGNSDAISGVTAYAKGVLVYDISALRLALLAQGITDIQSWCDLHLVFVRHGEPLYVSPMLHDQTAFSPSNCLDYCVRDGNVGWGQSYMKETLTKYNYPINGSILFSIPCTDGTYYISYQTPITEGLMLPKKYYWISSSPGANSFPIFTSSAIYNTSQCTDYSNRYSSVYWSDSDVLESKDSSWADGKTIMLACRCDNGTTYYSYQSVAGSTSLIPQHKYLIIPNDSSLLYHLNIDNLNSVKIKKGNILSDTLEETNINTIRKGALKLNGVTEKYIDNIQI